MNQQLFKWLHAISVIIFLFFIGSYSVEASEMTFSVKAILPDIILMLKQKKTHLHLLLLMRLRNYQKKSTYLNTQPRLLNVSLLYRKNHLMGTF